MEGFKELLILMVVVWTIGRLFSNVGLAMNNRGAVELVIASVGLSAGIIDQTIFSVLVLMAFVTTVISILVTPMIARKA